MRTNEEYQNQAAELVKPYSKTFAIIYLIIFVVNALLGFLGRYLWGLTDIALLAIEGPIAIGLVQCLIDCINNKEPKIENIIDRFDKNYLNTFLVNLLKSVFVGIGLVLLIVPGVIVALYLSMVEFMYYEDPTQDIMSYFKKSKEMMEGHKMELFKLYLSYILWILLCILTFGILTLWVAPKIHMAKYQYYLDLKAQYEAAKPEEKNEVEAPKAEEAPVEEVKTEEVTEEEKTEE